MFQRGQYEHYAREQNETIEFKNSYLTQPTITPELRLVQIMRLSTGIWKDAPPTRTDS